MEAGGRRRTTVRLGRRAETDGYRVRAGAGPGAAGHVWSAPARVVACGGVFGGCRVRIRTGLWLVGMASLPAHRQPGVSVVQPGVPFAMGARRQRYRPQVPAARDPAVAGLSLLLAGGDAIVGHRSALCRPTLRARAGVGGGLDGGGGARCPPRRTGSTAGPLDCAIRRAVVRRLAGAVLDPAVRDPDRSALRSADADGLAGLDAFPADDDTFGTGAVGAGYAVYRCS